MTAETDEKGESSMQSRISSWLGILARLWRRSCAELSSRWRLLRSRPAAGYSTETVIVTALLVLLALTVIGILVARVTAKVNGIDLS
jgi:hypothetical protein